MASESAAPPPPSSGGATYAIIGVALLIAAGGLAWCLASDPGTADPVADVRPDAGHTERSTALVEDDFEIPELEPDGGPEPDAGQEPTKRTGGTRPSRAWDDCTGEIQAAQARAVFGQFNAQIRSCYERRLKADQFLQGDLVVSVRVAADGRVDGTQLSGSLRDREVFSCVRSVTSRMRFPAPGGRDCAIVQVPYRFTPAQ